MRVSIPGPPIYFDFPDPPKLNGIWDEIQKEGIAKAVAQAKPEGFLLITRKRLAELLLTERAVRTNDQTMLYADGKYLNAVRRTAEEFPTDYREE
jgi:hypothetical protein